MIEVATRQKEILYSSRTRDNVDRFADMQRERHALGRLLKSLPPELRTSPEGRAMEKYSDRKVYAIAHLIYRAKEYEGDSKDYEFSRTSMMGHWKEGYNDTIRTLRHPEVLQRPTSADGLAVYDFTSRGDA